MLCLPVVEYKGPRNEAKLGVRRGEGLGDRGDNREFRAGAPGYSGVVLALLAYFVCALSAFPPV